jgi:hypothetical protein
MSAEVTVHRASQVWRDRLRAYALVIDGTVVAKVRQGETVSVPVTPGDHRIWMRIDWGRSRILHTEVADNERMILAAASGIPFLLLGLLYATLLRTRYIKLEEVRREAIGEADASHVAG